MNEDGRQKWIITFSVMTGTIMASLDASIVNVALPNMRGNLGASVEEITWVATAYILSSVIMMPIVAFLSSRFGRRSFYMFCVSLFTLSSMLCGMAWNLGSIAAFRALQGIGGGALIPIAQAILRETWPLEEQGTAMGIYGMGVVLGPALGPTVGGWITDQYSWPWIFYINVPVGIVNILLVSRYIHDPPYLVRDRGVIDFPGLVFLIISLGAFQLMLEKGEQNDWFESMFITQLAIIASIGFVLFIFRELTTDRPAVDIRILKNISFASGTFLSGVLGMGLFGGLFLLPLLLQQLLGYSAYDSGLALMPRAIAMAITLPVAGRLYNRMGPIFLVGPGLMIIAYSFWELSRLSLDAGAFNILIPQFTQGVGFGMIFVALSTAALSTIEKPRMQAATGLYNVVRMIFGSVGIAVAATQLVKGQIRYRAILVETVTDFSDVTGTWVKSLSALVVSNGTDPVTAHDKALHLLDMVILRQATMLSFNHVFFLVASLFLIATPFVLLLRRGKPSSSETS